MSDEARLPAALEASALIRRVQGEGGFAAVLQKGEPDAGTLMLVLAGRAAMPRIYERMPQPDGGRAWTLVKVQDPEIKEEFTEYLSRRGKQDRDLWIVELDIDDAERFIGLKAQAG
jgi:hypothetical protein